MKTMLLVVGMVFVGSMGWAYEIQGNPDRRISIGLNYDRSNSSSEYKFGSLKVSDFTKVSGDNFLVDLKIPVSSIFTFQVRGGYGSSNDDIFTGENVKATGYDIGVGVRFYIN